MHVTPEIGDPGSTVKDTVPALLVRLIRSAALQLGIPAQEIDLSAGLGPAVLADDLVRVPTATANRIWQLAHATAGDDTGLLAAKATAPAALHAWDYLVVSGSTLAEGLAEGARLFTAVTDPAVTLDVQEDGRLLTVSYLGLPFQEDVDREIGVFALATLLHRVRKATGTRPAPVRVQFAHPAPRRHQHLRDAFDTDRIDFGQPETSFTFLDPVRDPATADPELFRIMRRYLEMSLAAARPVPTWLDTFHAALAHALAAEQCSTERVAARLGLSTRTLQRRLAEHGTTWRDEVDLARHRQAVCLLRDTQLPMKAIATRLGYSDHRVLRRAFQRWTGHTPDHYRALQR